METSRYLQFMQSMDWSVNDRESGEVMLTDISRNGRGPASSAVIFCPLQRVSETAIEVHRGRVQALQNMNSADAQQLRR